MSIIRKSIYLESSFFSFLCADPSPIQKTFEKQRDTVEWRSHHRSQYDLCVSDEVFIEIARGDPDFARRRLEKAAEPNLVIATQEDRMLAAELLSRQLLPQDSLVDATHLAIAVRLKLDILLTRNLKHLANPYILPLVHAFLKGAGLHIPVIMTPSALLESM